jgi:hypothetical protein
VAITQMTTTEYTWTLSLEDIIICLTTDQKIASPELEGLKRQLREVGDKPEVQIDAHQQVVIMWNERIDE